MADEKAAEKAPVKAAAPDLSEEPSRYSGMTVEQAKKMAAADAKGDTDADLSRTMDPADDKA